MTDQRTTGFTRRGLLGVFAATALVASRATLVRARTLNSEDKNVSDRALQEAEARVKSEETRQKSATELAVFFEGAISGNGKSSTWTEFRGSFSSEAIPTNISCSFFQASGLTPYSLSAPGVLPPSSVPSLATRADGVNLQYRHNVALQARHDFRCGHV